MTSQKKSDKSRAKSEKKSAKTELKQQKKSAANAPDDGPSPAVRFAEYVRGGLFVLTGVSMIVALVLGQRGAIMSLDDVIDSLFAATAGKIILILIGLALLIYGFKQLRLVR